MITRELLEAIVARLKVKVPGMAVELFPERPEEYRLNHPAGAILVSYNSSRFDTTTDMSFVVQPRMTVVSLNVLRRQLNGNTGILDVMDAVRLALVGFKPPNCRRKIWAIQEKYLGETAGVWQYALDLGTEMIQVEEPEADNRPVLTVVNYEEDNE